MPSINSIKSWKNVINLQMKTIRTIADLVLHLTNIETKLHGVEKVKELLTRGYAQYEIASLLHISQPTISRDIHYIQKEIRKSAENYSEHLFEIYRNTMLGLDETIKKLWAIIDSPRTDGKERIKAIALLKECYKERLDLISSEPSLIRQKKHMDTTKLFANIPS